ncbi:MAG TPA: ArsA-related P-loop ATPase [Acidimicrobiales bacterium]|nr:ArsA-related P-loop ATPase [Acidimicrobiales bacterium]
MSLAELSHTRTTLICCGTGGVGKTTVAAALALGAARQGRRACVVTIDPAKRLADALGLDTLPNQATVVKGDWNGELWALMLDTKGTFDDLVTRYAGSPDQAAGILDNRLYRNLSQALSGTQEYMAMEKLFELHEENRFDLIVVDTPPTRNALDFLDAPRRLMSFLDNRIFRLLVLPTRAYLKAVSVATQAFLRTVSKVVGAEVVDDAVAFFRAFEGMEQGFRDRAARVEALLADAGTAFVVVASARRDTVEEALFFVDRLDQTGFDVAALVVNRLQPRFAPTGTAERLKQETGAQETGGEAAPAPALVNLAQLEALADREESHFAHLVQRVEPAPVVRVPVLPIDVHDLRGLDLVAGYLEGERAG